MKIALLADIHGNHHALACVLDAAKKLGCTKLLIAGDFVGYYYHPDIVFELLADWDYDAVKGNHEVMLLDSLSNSENLKRYTKKYGSGLKSAINNLGEAEISYLCELKEKIEITVGGIEIMLCHGSPYDVNQYVYPNANKKLVDSCNKVNKQLLVMGHTHYPMLKEIDNKIIVNPGSVGQPRDRIPGACWAVLDTKTQEIKFHREQYDNTELLEEAVARDPAIPYLSEVLTRQ